MAGYARSRSPRDVVRRALEVTGPLGRSAHEHLGPAARRALRTWQWAHPRYRLRHVPPETCPDLAAEHATPLMRELAGLDMALQRGKVTNLRIAAARLDGLALGPGQRLSFWRQVGSPSARRGFVDGLVLDHGRLRAGTGGGMCQFTNLLFWVTLHTPLVVTERWRHSYDVFPDNGRTQPFGSGATCAWPALDLQVDNPTPLTFRLSVQVTDTHLHGRWYADRPVAAQFEVYEADHIMTNDAPGVFTRRNVLRRRVLEDGIEVHDELVAVNAGRLMYAPFLAAGS
ncbi:VanW family protein [Cellulomonas bogoriensis]|uniref:Vancomycin resistance protein n=1 Tax=Cellulomonas bogoriensis 69B4 = DSM 16987 TaxID=1386082 RepID=A0A0A0C2H2_9CELL|nr:VanW family protein [Cellulomonas bogoriensis]KGM13574.1 vancomycin resistance protein [Cellulomonas bogoriensis 69B4 = DSM 16987]